MSAPSLHRESNDSLIGNVGNVSNAGNVGDVGNTGNYTCFR